MSSDRDKIKTVCNENHNYLTLQNIKGKIYGKKIYIKYSRDFLN